MHFGSVENCPWPCDHTSKLPGWPYDHGNIQLWLVQYTEKYAKPHLHSSTCGTVTPAGHSCGLRWSDHPLLQIHLRQSMWTEAQWAVVCCNLPVRAYSERQKLCIENVGRATTQVSVLAHQQTRGFWGHAPQGILDRLRSLLVHFQVIILL